MATEEKFPATLTLKIEPAGLKRVVEDGRLLEFANTLSSLAAEQISYQLVEHLAQAGVGLKEVSQGVNIVVGFTIDDEYGTPWRPPIPRPPWPWPWPPWPWQVALSPELEEGLRQIVREEMAHG